MKKLTQTELMQLVLKQSVAGKQPNPLVKEARNIAVGESVLISREEWKLKNPPSSGNFDFKKHKFSARSLADNSGWVVTRIQ